jgi:hypothetical protein
MSMILQFRTDTSAFEDNRVREVQLILDRIGRTIDEGIRQGKVRDSNAVVIGQWCLDELSGVPAGQQPPFAAGGFWSPASKDG